MSVTEVVMPQMGADMKEGTVIRWLKAEGTEVARGEIIAEIETDKANIEIEAFGAGVFRKQIAKEGDVVPVGTVIAVIVEEGWPHGGVGANLAALIQEQAFDWLDAPVMRVTGADVPMPYSKPLEQAALPHEEHVVQAVLSTFRDL